jgi:hypothetical protein
MSASGQECDFALQQGRGDCSAPCLPPGPTGIIWLVMTFLDQLTSDEVLDAAYE